VERLQAVVELLDVILGLEARARSAIGPAPALRPGREIAYTHRGALPLDLGASANAIGGAPVEAVILAGGLGSRLSEETDVRPKPMVEIGGKR